MERIFLSQQSGKSENMGFGKKKIQTPVLGFQDHIYRRKEKEKKISFLS